MIRSFRCRLKYKALGNEPTPVYNIQNHTKQILQKAIKSKLPAMIVNDIISKIYLADA